MNAIKTLFKECFISRNRKLLRILRNNKKTNVFKRMGVRPPFVVKKCTKKQRKQKNNWEKPPLLLSIYRWRAVKPKKIPYIISITYISLTYSKTYNFKYKIPTQKQKHFIGEHLSITKGCFGSFLNHLSIPMSLRNF